MFLLSAVDSGRPRQAIKEFSGFSRDSRIQGFKDSRIQGFKDSRIQGFKDSRIQG